MSFVQLNEITISFGDRDILKDINLNLSSCSRVALSGGNGSGKTTLMKVISGIISPDSGTISSGNAIRISYLPQSGLLFRGRTLVSEADLAFNFFHMVSEKLVKIENDLSLLKENDRDLTKLLEKHHLLHEMLLSGSYYRREELIAQVLTGLGFSHSDFNRTCDEFSGGWQMRIALAKVLLENPDIMLLDEPTNYLDIEARNWLEEFLQKFKGGLLIVSHDRYFMDVTINEVVELFNGSLKRYKGNYSSYEATREAELIILIEQYKRQLGYGEFRLVVVTDGKAERIPDAARHAQGLRIPIYAIGLGIEGDHPLRTYAMSYREANKFDDLEKALEETLAELPVFDVAEFE